jgi:hypothetical protein
MGFFDFFKKKPAAQCVRCHVRPAGFRCNRCNNEHCRECLNIIMADTPKITNWGGANEAERASFEVALQRFWGELNELTDQGKPVCPFCSVQQMKPVALSHL